MEIFVKENVLQHEFDVYTYVQKHVHGVNTPRIVSYDAVTKRLEMERIPGMSLSDFYGEKAENIPDAVFDEVREIVATLRASRVTYPDITGYNFIRSDADDKLYVIDFEHAFVIDPFVDAFLAGERSWNSDFA